jgi:hypothetical protein
MAIDFKTIRMRYELLGDTLPELASEYNLNPEALDFLAKDEGWSQHLLPTPVTTGQAKDVEGYAKQLLEASKHKLSILSVYHQLALRPQYIELEQTLLAKAVSLAKHLDEKEVMAVSKLKTLTSVLNDLSQRLGLLAGAASEGEKMLQENGVSVNIIQQFVDGNVKAIQ